MITDPIVLEVLDRLSAQPTMVRGFSHVSRSNYLAPRENSPLWYGATARSIGGTKLIISSVFGLRISLTLSSGGP
jgi:hypothetical protein